MLGRGDAVASAVERIFPREIGGVKLIEKLECGERVRTQEIDQMRSATDGGGFLGGDAAKAEIMQLEAEERRITGAHEGFANDLLDGARKCSNRDGIPNLDEKRFGPIGEPVELGIGVFDGDERVVCFDDSAFLDGADAQREVATVFGVEGFEAVVVEAFRMAGEVGVRNAEFTQITGGLSAGEPMISSGGYALPDNTQIKIEAPAPAEKEVGDKSDDTKKPDASAKPSAKEKD